MTPEYISLKEGFTVADALERIRRLCHRNGLLPLYH